MMEEKELHEQPSEEVTEATETVEAEEVVEVDEKDAKIAELEAKVAEFENRFLRNQADFDNFRRRVRLDQEAAEKYRAQSLVSDLLPVVDNLERALQIEVADEQAKSLQQGVQMVQRALLEALQKEGVEEIAAVGEAFDPNVHQAVMQVEDAEHPSNTVVEQFQKGYKLKDRVIRPAMVKVNA